MLVGHWPRPPQLQQGVSAVTSSQAPASADSPRQLQTNANVRTGHWSAVTMSPAEMSVECPHGQPPPGTWPPASPMLLVRQPLVMLATLTVLCDDQRCARCCTLIVKVGAVLCSEAEKICAV